MHHEDPPREFHAQQLTLLTKAAACFRRHVSARRRRVLGVCATTLLMLAALGCVLLSLHVFVIGGGARGVTAPALSVAHSTLDGGRISFPVRPAAAFFSAGTAVSQEVDPGSLGHRIATFG